MKHKQNQGSSAGSASMDTPQQQVWKPTWVFRLTTSFMVAATVALAIGALALVDHYLQFINILYDGTDPRFQGKEVSIYYCMLSATGSQNMPSRCNYAFTVAAISLAFSTGWIIHEASVRRGRKPLSHHLTGWAICWLAAGWWLAAGIVLSIWTNQANQAGLPAEVQRNGLCAMAFIVAGFFTALVLFKMFQPDSPLAQKMYGRKRAAAKSAPIAAPAAAARATTPTSSAAVEVPTAAARVEGVAPAAAGAAAGALPAAVGPSGGAWSNTDLAPGGAAHAADAV